MIEFDTEDEVSRATQRVLRPAPRAEAADEPVTAAIRQLTGALASLLKPTPPPDVRPVINLPAPTVTVKQAPARSRTVECHFEREWDGRIKSPLTFKVIES